jgi:hypothetical protein
MLGSVFRSIRAEAANAFSARSMKDSGNDGPNNDPDTDKRCGSAQAVAPNGITRTHKRKKPQAIAPAAFHPSGAAEGHSYIRVFQ